MDSEPGSSSTPVAAPKPKSRNPSAAAANSRKPSTRTPIAAKKQVITNGAKDGEHKNAAKSSKSAVSSGGKGAPSAGTTIKTQAVVNMVSSGTLKSEISVSADSLGSSRSTKKSFSGTNMHSSLGYLP